MKTLLLLLVFIFSTRPLFAQHLNSSYTDVVFEDKTNIRESPSLQGKVIGTIRHNQEVQQCGHTYVADTISGKAGHWMKISHGKQPGYIWQANLADGVFKSECNINDVFLINYSSSNELEFKVFSAGNLKHSTSFVYPKPRNILGSYSFGKIQGSRENEVIAVAFENEGYELFEWNGKEIVKSTLRLNEASILTGKFHSYPWGIINANSVNLRATPDSAGAIVANLSSGTRISLVPPDSTSFYVWDPSTRWQAVHWKGSVAYVWTDLVDRPLSYIRSNVNDRESFLYTDHALYAFIGEKIADRQPLDIYGYDGRNKLIDFGTLGLKQGFRVLAICYSSNGCGTPGGDLLYTWNGSRLRFLADDYSVGDGGLFTLHNYVFPIQFGGLADRVILREVEGESAGGGEDDCGGSESGITFDQSFVMKIEGDSLLEVPSKHSEIRSFIAGHFPDYRLMHHTLHDLNRDGIEDVVFFLDQPLYWDEQTKRVTPVIGIAYGNSAGHFDRTEINTELVKRGAFAVRFEVKSDSLVVRIEYNIGYGAGEFSKPSYSEFTYVYDKELQALRWWSKTEAGDINGESWEIEWSQPATQYFKSKKIRFSESWDESEYIEEGD